MFGASEWAVHLASPTGMRWRQGALLGLATCAMPTGMAVGDAPGPTDFESAIVEMVAVDGSEIPDAVTVTVEGVDSFLLLSVSRGSTVSIPGYDDEPYLRIDADCSVWQNRLSWSTWYNEDRYGDVERPDIVDPSATPQWVVIDDDCSVAWHDHRIHWMNPTPPIGAEPGDVVTSALVPFIVDGISLSVRVESTLASPPSPRSSLAGLILGVAVVATVMVFGGRRIAAASVWLAGVSGISTIIGATTFLLTPADTGPDPRWWVLPLAATFAGLLSALLERSGRWFWATGSLLVSGLVLGLWSWDRRTGLWRALIPSPWPGSVDRMVTAGTAVVATAAVIAALTVLISPGTERSSR